MLHWAPEEGRTCYRLCPEGLPEWGRRRPHRPWNRTGFPLGKLGRGWTRLTRMDEDTRGWTGLTLQPSPPRGFTPGGIRFLSGLPKLGRRYQNPTQQDPFFSLQIVRKKKQRWGCLSPHRAPLGSPSSPLCPSLMGTACSSGQAATWCPWESPLNLPSPPALPPSLLEPVSSQYRPHLV